MCLLAVSLSTYAKDLISPAPALLCFHHRSYYKTSFPVLNKSKNALPDLRLSHVDRFATTGGRYAHRLK